MRRALEELRWIYRKVEERNQDARCVIRSRITELLMERGFTKGDAVFLTRGFLSPSENILPETPMVGAGFNPNWMIVREGYVDGQGRLTPRFYEALSRPRSADSARPTQWERLTGDDGDDPSV